MRLLTRNRRWIRGWIGACVLIAACASAARPASARSPIDPVLAPYAGDVEAAVDRGLQYLAASQREDGSFPGSHGDTPGVVGLAGMAFLAVGYAPGDETRHEYSLAIERCFRFVLSSQNENGYISRGSRGGMYSHGIATLFLSELSGMAPPEWQRSIDRALPAALRVIIAAQNVEKTPLRDGGWRYTPSTRESDLSVSGWNLMALRSARLNGARIPDDNIQRGVAYILRSQDKEGEHEGGFRYMPDRPDGRAYMVVQTGLAVLCLELTGLHESEEIRMGRRFMLNNYRRLAGIRNELYGVYYYAQASFHAGGELWEQYARWMYERYLPRQLEDGSWPADQGSQAYSTAMALLSLTVPYRQLPIYVRDETVDE